MRFVIVSALAAVLSVAAIAPAISQGAGQPAATRAYMVEPFTPAAPITITATGVRLRAEPFTGNTPVLSSGATGMQLTVVGISRQPDWNWYQVVLRNGQKAFIRSDLTSAPLRGDGAPAPVVSSLNTYPAPVRPPVAVAPVVAPPVLAPPVAPQPPISLPLPAAQPLPPIPTQPLANSGAISLTPGAAAAPLPPVSNPAPAAVENGLLAVSPTAPTPRLGPISPAVSSSPSNVGQQIRAQLDAKRCWSDSSNMMDADRLKASFAVSFNANGRFAAEPRLIEPAAEPAGDPAMMVFIAKARAALRTCNALGYDVPAGYATGGEVRVDFSAR
jgi:hypothetical protein